MRPAWICATVVVACPPALVAAWVAAYPPPSCTPTETVVCRWVIPSAEFRPGGRLHGWREGDPIPPLGGQDRAPLHPMVYAPLPPWRPAPAVVAPVPPVRVSELPSAWTFLAGLAGFWIGRGWFSRHQR